MRRWGYGLAGLLVFAFFVGANNASDSASDIQSTTTLGSEQNSSTGEPEPAASEPAQTESASEANQEPESTESEAPSPTPTQTAANPEPETSSYEQLLAQLRIADEYPSGYDRDLFRHWIDADGDGCNARREVLIAEAVEKPSVVSDCDLVGGLWYSAYDGLTTNDPGDFDIDHIVALKEAWDSGAYAWDSDRRRAFANDLDLPQALIAVSASSNRSKSDKDPADWLPPLSSYHCQYIEDWMLVKVKWELTVDAREFNALRSVAAGC